VKKLSIINLHDYPSSVQYEFAQRAKALAEKGLTWDQVAEEMRDARGVPADPRGCEMAYAKWGAHTGYYTVYWEIGMTQDAPFNWHVRIIDYGTANVVSERTGSAITEEEARRASQQWVLDNIEQYRVEAA
jgi:hypothetical protein